MEVKPTGKEAWILFHQFSDDEDFHIYTVYDSQKAFAVDFREAYRNIILPGECIDDEEIDRAKKELLKKHTTENEKLGLYMWIEIVNVYGLDEYETCTR